MPHHHFQNRTIPRLAPTPLPYERSVCFASCKTSGVQLRASMPVPCQRELDCDKATSIINCLALRFKYIYILSALSVARLRDCHTLRTTLSKTALFLRPAPHSWLMNALLALHPCKASGRSTSGIHARPLSKVRCCRPKKFGRLPEGLPHHHFQNRTIPSPCTTFLAPLSKGSWIATRLLLS